MTVATPPDQHLTMNEATADTTPPAAVLEWTHWGRVRYADALRRQLDRHAAVLAGALPPAIYTLEHEPVITLGKRGQDSDVLVPSADLQRQGVDVVRVERGGEATWHGPGQLVVYVVLRLEDAKLGVSDLVRGLADVIRQELRLFGVEAAYDAERPGLWVNGRKITAVGMRITRGVSLHGAALNVNNDLRAFAQIVPCGIPDAGVTSVAQETGREPGLHGLGARIASRFAERIGYTLVERLAD